MEVGCYLHIPFCKSKCPYCDFFSVTERPDEDLYLKALSEEIRLKAENLTKALSGEELKIITLYAGGGSPTLFSPRFFEGVLRMLEKFFFFEPVELTLEANPEGLTLEKAKAFREVGFNRISLGVQTFHPGGLSFLGRRHSPKEALMAIEASLKAGFENISLDFIYGWKGQGKTLLQRDIELARSLDIKHLSFYELTIYPGTPFYHFFGERPPFLREDRLLDLKKTLKKALSASDFIQYEISNYAKSTFECRHNLLYWEVKPYLGFGAGAVSRIGNERLKNTEDLRSYFRDLLEKKSLPSRVMETLSEKALVKEYIFMGLRLTKGIEISRLEKGGYKIREEVINYLHSKRYIYRDKERLWLTDRGSLLHNQVVKFLWNNLEVIK